MNNQAKWYKLDNAANLFPVISNKEFSNVFRISVMLKEDIHPIILKNALTETLPLFPNFGVKMKKGVFWYYFEKNYRKPIIEEEQDYPCVYINPKNNNNFLFKITYYKKKINLDVFHSITDGFGGIAFLKALVLNYIKLSNRETFTVEQLNIPVIDIVSDIEDSYNKNYKKTSLRISSVKKAFKIKDSKYPLAIISVIHGIINTDSFLKYCKQNDCTLTQYLTASFIWCIYKEYLNEQKSNKPIVITVPVDLRKYFSSTTLTNFFSLIEVIFKVEKDNYTFDEILEEVKTQFKEKITKENMTKKIAQNVAIERNILARFVPLFLKNLVVRTGYNIAKKGETAVVTNVGRITLPDEFKEYVDHFSVIVEANKDESIKCGICSYEDKLVCTIVSKFENRYIEKSFFRHLKEMGIDVIIESNGVGNERM